MNITQIWVKNNFSYYEFNAVKYQRNDRIILLLGKRIRATRVKQGISQNQLAFESGIRINQIGRIERGEINTSISVIFAIAKALNLKPHDLINFDKE